MTDKTTGGAWCWMVGFPLMLLSAAVLAVWQGVGFEEAYQQIIDLLYGMIE